MRNLRSKHALVGLLGLLLVGAALVGVSLAGSTSASAALPAIAAVPNSVDGTVSLVDPTTGAILAAKSVKKDIGDPIEVIPTEHMLLVRGTRGVAFIDPATRAVVNVVKYPPGVDANDAKSALLRPLENGFVAIIGETVFEVDGIDRPEMKPVNKLAGPGYKALELSADQRSAFVVDDEGKTIEVPLDGGEPMEVPRLNVAHTEIPQGIQIGPDHVAPAPVVSTIGSTPVVLTEQGLRTLDSDPVLQRKIEGLKPPAVVPTPDPLRIAVLTKECELVLVSESDRSAVNVGACRSFESGPWEIGDKRTSPDRKCEEEPLTGSCIPEAAERIESGSLEPETCREAFQIGRVISVLCESSVRLYSDSGKLKAMFRLPEDFIPGPLQPTTAGPMYFDAITQRAVVIDLQGAEVHTVDLRPGSGERDGGSGGGDESDGNDDGSGKPGGVIKPDPEAKPAPDQQPPIAVDDVAEGPNDQAVVIPVVANDGDPNLDPLAVADVTKPEPAGTVSSDGGSRVVFTPPKGAASGTFTFSYTLTDGTCDWSKDVSKPDGERECTDVAGVTVTTSDTGNIAPQAMPDHVVVSVGKPVLVDATANDIDPDSRPDKLRIKSVGAASPTNLARVEKSNGGQVSVTAMKPGTGTISYVVTDGEDRAEGIISVEAVSAATNAPPIANPDVAVVDTADEVSVDVLANDVDPEQGRLTIVAVQPRDAAMIRGGQLVVSVENKSEVKEIAYTIQDDREQVDSSRLIVKGTGAMTEKRTEPDRIKTTIPPTTTTTTTAPTATTTSEPPKSTVAPTTRLPPTSNPPATNLPPVVTSAPIIQPTVRPTTTSTTLATTTTSTSTTTTAPSTTAATTAPSTLPTATTDPPCVVGTNLIQVLQEAQAPDSVSVRLADAATEAALSGGPFEVRWSGGAAGVMADGSATLTGLQANVPVDVEVVDLSECPQYRSSMTTVVAYGFPTAPVITDVRPGTSYVEVWWSAPSDWGGANPLGYTLRLHSAQTGAIQTILPSSGDTFFRFGGLEQGSYTVEILARTGVVGRELEVEGPATEWVTATEAVVPPSVNANTIRATADVAASTVNVVWEMSPNNNTITEVVVELLDPGDLMIASATSSGGGNSKVFDTTTFSQIITSDIAKVRLTLYYTDQAGTIGLTTMPVVDNVNLGVQTLAPDAPPLSVTRDLSLTTGTVLVSNWAPSTGFAPVNQCEVLVDGQAVYIVDGSICLAGFTLAVQLAHTIDQDGVVAAVETTVTVRATNTSGSTDTQQVVP